MLDIGSKINSLIDTCTLMFNNQEILYEIRRMNEQQFVAKWSKDLSELHKTIKKCCDLNYKRSILIDGIDQEMLKKPDEIEGKIVDTLGNLIDKLITVKLKDHFLGNKDFNKHTNLVMQKDRLIKEINQKASEILSLDVGDITRPQHKTY